VRLFLILLSPFVAFIVFVQAVRLDTSMRSRVVVWRGELRSREKEPFKYWLLVFWNVLITIGLLYLYVSMTLREFG
jgi:hypothetical protein